MSHPQIAERYSPRWWGGVAGLEGPAGCNHAAGFPPHLGIPRGVTRNVWMWRRCGLLRSRGQAHSVFAVPVDRVERLAAESEARSGFLGTGL